MKSIWNKYLKVDTDKSLKTTREEWQEIIHNEWKKLEDMKKR